MFKYVNHEIYYVLLGNSEKSKVLPRLQGLGNNRTCLPITFIRLFTLKFKYSFCLST